MAPSNTIICGFSAAISASSHGRHASISFALGSLWMRRFPRVSDLSAAFSQSRRSHDNQVNAVEKIDRQAAEMPLHCGTGMVQ